MKNIEDLRAILFDELEALQHRPESVNLELTKLKCLVAEKIISSIRVEVQLAAILGGALEVPFIENQTGERSSGDRTALGPTQIEDAKPLTPMERAARVLGGGPPPGHPWRQAERGKD